ncbi:YWTD domain-containing protein [Tothia fuscella]|uniref:YWTD domain-containing protein n=1 Tax=Tothia fuscella TaxID=1048955 RepID=A0A9P4U014_9PEZI|nr:YWTD domain-containing protein [Tothia fuscella]
MVYLSFRSVAALLLLSLSTISLATPISINATDVEAQAVSRLYYLDQREGRIQSCKPDGTDTKTIATELRSVPDGIAVDRAAGLIYFSNMGRSAGSGARGSIQSVKLDGTGLATIVAVGKTHTAKQLTLATVGGKKMLYWGDREGMKVMRCNVDGSGLEVVVDTAGAKCAGSPQCKHVVGVAVDAENGFVYWTQKGGSSAGEGSIHRAGISLPAGATAASRPDVQNLLTGLPEPIDLRWVKETGTLYWTDRATSPGGNSVNRLQIANGASPVQISATKQMLFNGIGAGIGIAVDVAGKQLWATSLNGGLYSSDLEGKGKKQIGRGLGLLVGIDFA